MSTDLQQRREATVREHMDSENRHDFDATIATMAHPRYELIPTGDVYDGEEAVRAYFAETRAGFPDQRNRLLALFHGEDTVVAEFILEGTHAGTLRGLPPTGKPFTCQMMAAFVFEAGGDRIVCERVYFNPGTILQQLGLASDPLSVRGRVETALAHPLTIVGAFARRAFG